MNVVCTIGKEAGIMEQWGTGVQRVYDRIAEAGLPEPQIEEVMDRLRFTTFVPSHAPDASPHAGTKHQDEAPSRSGAALSASEVALLRHARVAPASRAELIAALGITNQTRAFRRHIEPLLATGLLERTVPDKPTSRDQRYRITKLGSTLLEEHETSA